MNYFIRKFNSVVRYLLVYKLNNLIPNIIITEYPRSGGTWLSNMLAAYFAIPFPANKLPSFKKSVIHGHYLYKRNMKNTICLVRDVRDVVVSYYFFLLFYSKEKNTGLYKKMKEIMSFKDYENIEQNLPEFIDKLFKYKIYPRFTWQEFVVSFYNKGEIIMLRYEDLLNNTSKEMGRLLFELVDDSIKEDRLKTVIENFNLSKMKKRHKSSNDPRKNFVRKGKSGDWKNYFNKESAELINFYAGEGLKLMNYERDDSWIRKFLQEEEK